MMQLLTVLYVLIAVAMIALILMQRGAGAQAGSGFGGGASATVFGARGASNFLSNSTKWLAITFFSISLFMAWHASRGPETRADATDLGVMSELPAQRVPTAPSIPQAAPRAIPAPVVPQINAPAATAPAPTAVPAPAQAPANQPAGISPSGN